MRRWRKVWRWRDLTLLLIKILTRQACKLFIDFIDIKSIVVIILLHNGVVQSIGPIGISPHYLVHRSTFELIFVLFNDLFSQTVNILELKEYVLYFILSQALIIKKYLLV